MIKGALIIPAIMLLLLPWGAHGAESSMVRESPGESALLTGFGITHRGFGATRTQVETFDLIFRYGHFLSRNVGEGRWYEGRHELLVESQSSQQCRMGRF